MYGVDMNIMFTQPYRSVRVSLAFNDDLVDGFLLEFSAIEDLDARDHLNGGLPSLGSFFFIVGFQLVRTGFV